MDKYCLGCGVKLQNANVLFEGYTVDLENDLCSRCFKIKNYGEYELVTKSNEENIEILRSVGKTKDLVLYIVDLLNIPKDINMIREYIENRLILVLTKRDVLPKSIKDEKIIKYFSKSNLNYEDIIIISSNKNYNIDELLLMIKKYKSSKNIYVVGNTNVGKSTLINKMIKNYKNEEQILTISPLPSTTLNKVEIKLSDDITLIDTPGFIDRGNIINYLSSDDIKKMTIKKEIKPITHQLRDGQNVVVDNFFSIDYLSGGKNSFTFYISNNISIKKNIKDHNKNTKTKRTIEVGYLQDIVINGLGFIKVMEKCRIDMYIEANIEVFVRDSLIK